MGIGNTSLDILLRRMATLSEAEAWLKIFDSSTKSQIIEWIQQDQLTQKGIDGSGNVIGYYSPITELITRGRKKAYTHYTLDDTGEFYRSMYVAVFRESFAIIANGDKGEDNLFEKYGKDIIDLTDENLEKLKEIAKEKFIKYIREVLQIG